MILRYSIVLTLIAFSVHPRFASADDTALKIRIGKSESELITAKLTVSDLRRSYDFYTKTIGLKQIETPNLPKPSVEDRNVEEICLNFSGSMADPFMCLLRQKDLMPTREVAKLFCISFKTPDARAARTRVKAAGFELVGDVIEFGGLITGFAQDPDGYTVQFIQAESTKP